jgi:hypothetical protein
MTPGNWTFATVRQRERTKNELRQFAGAQLCASIEAPLSTTLKEIKPNHTVDFHFRLTYDKCNDFIAA